MLDWRLAALALGNFVVGTGSLMLPGMLNEISADLQRPIASLGLLVAMSQLAGGLSAPFVAIATSRIDRRLVLVIALVLAAASHFVTALAVGMGLLLIARAVTGITGTALTPQIAGSAGLLVSPEQRGRALSTALLGYNFSSVLGVPVGVALAGMFGWRNSFLIIGALAVLTALLVHRAVPARLPLAPMDRSAWGEVARNPAIVAALAFNALQFMAQMTLFAYIAPVLLDSLGASPGQIALLLSWFGACGVASALVSTRFIDRVGTRYLTRQSAILMFSAMLLWPLAHGSFAGTMALFSLFAFGAFPLGGAQQSFLVGVNPRLATVSVAFNSSAALLGAALGALLGARLIATVGYSMLSWASAGILVAAFIALLVAQANAPARDGAA